MADDYGALAMTQMLPPCPAGDDAAARIEVILLDARFAKARDFELGGIAQ